MDVESTPTKGDAASTTSRDDDSIQVVCRIRPQNSREAAARCHDVVTVNEADGLVVIGALGKYFSFDTVLGQASSQV
jgi:hypothetical protein